MRHTLLAIYLLFYFAYLSVDLSNDLRNQKKRKEFSVGIIVVGDAVLAIFWPFWMAVRIVALLMQDV